MNSVEYVKKIFDDKVLVMLGAVWAFIYGVFFPESSYALGAAAVLAMMALDILTKLYSLKRQAGGWKCAYLSRRINSRSFWRGTFDKIIVFLVLQLMCGLVYRIIFISEVAVWMTQFVFGMMFFRDAISVIENLIDAGIGGLGLIKKALMKKRNELLECDENDVGTDQSKADQPQVLGGVDGAGDERHDCGGKDGE